MTLNDLEEKIAKFGYNKGTRDLYVRIFAHKNLIRMGLNSKNGYHGLARLIGSPANTGLIGLSEEEVDILKLLAGPNAHTIYRMLLIKHGLTESQLFYRN